MLERYLNDVYAEIILVLDSIGKATRDYIITSVYKKLGNLYSLYTIEKYFYNLVRDGIIVKTGTHRGRTYYTLSSIGKVIASIVKKK